VVVFDVALATQEWRHTDAIAGGTTLTFASTAGETQTATVVVNGDTLFELDETFGVTLGVPSNPAVTVSAATGTGSITNDDTAPTISISSPSQDEGNAGSVPMSFVVSLSTAAGRDIIFTRETEVGSPGGPTARLGQARSAAAPVASTQVYGLHHPPQRSRSRGPTDAGVGAHGAPGFQAQPAVARALCQRVLQGVSALAHVHARGLALGVV